MTPMTPPDQVREHAPNSDERPQEWESRVGPSENRELQLATNESPAHVVALHDKRPGINPDIEAADISEVSMVITWPRFSRDTGFLVSGYRIAAAEYDSEIDSHLPYVAVCENTKSTECIFTVTNLRPGRCYRFKIAALTWHRDTNAFRIIARSVVTSKLFKTKPQDYQFAWFFGNVAPSRRRF